MGEIVTTKIPVNDEVKAFFDNQKKNNINYNYGIMAGGKSMREIDEISKLKEALRLAKSILEYVSGDDWERAVTRGDREKFNNICGEFKIE